MRKGFTIVEVSILFVIFLIVAFLVAPLSLDDTMQAKNTSRWRTVQQDFSNIFYSINSQREESIQPFSTIIESIFENEIKDSIQKYKIEYMNGSTPENRFQFDNFKITYSNATVSIKMNDNPNDKILGLVMYDVNGKNKPNVWGKDVFGLYIFKDHFEPFGKGETINKQKQDCSRSGTGLFCSNYYLIGGNFD